jgi:hypothetical protein
MRLNDDVPPTATPALSSATTVKKDNSEAGLFGRSRSYKFWALVAIILLAVWSMFTGSVTLKWSAGNLTRFSDTADSLILDDLDILVPNTFVSLFLAKKTFVLFSVAER